MLGPMLRSPVAAAACMALIGATALHAQSDAERGMGRSDSSVARPQNEAEWPLHTALEGDRRPFLCKRRDSVNLIVDIMAHAFDVQDKDADKAQRILEIASRLQGELLHASGRGRYRDPALQSRSARHGACRNLHRQGQRRHARRAVEGRAGVFRLDISQHREQQRRRSRRAERQQPMVPGKRKCRRDPQPDVGRRDHPANEAVRSRHAHCPSQRTS